MFVEKIEPRGHQHLPEQYKPCTSNHSHARLTGAGTSFSGSDLAIQVRRGVLGREGEYLEAASCRGTLKSGSTGGSTGVSECASGSCITPTAPVDTTPIRRRYHHNTTPTPRQHHTTIPPQHQNTSRLHAIRKLWQCTVHHTHQTSHNNLHLRLCLQPLSLFLRLLQLYRKISDIF